MRPRSLTCGLCVALAGGVLSGCQQPSDPVPLATIEKDYDRPLPPGQWALRKIDASAHPRFGDGWYLAKGTGLLAAIDQSIDYLHAPSSKGFFPSGEITHERALASVVLFREIVEQAGSPESLEELIRENFDVYISVGCDDVGTVLFTGYYSPIFDGSLTRTERFKYPLYRLPPGFEKDPEGNPIEGLWNTREEIERGGLLAGNEIVWLADPFEAYVLTVQGSGFIRLSEAEELFEIGYAGHNGHEYVPIGRMLVADGKIKSTDLSLDSLIRHFRENPADFDKYIYQNKRYVFFRESSGGPYGCLGRAVTAEHSIATDKDIFPRGCVAFVDTRVPKRDAEGMRMYRSFVLDQDRGAAIRAPGRCDLYMGVGDEAGRRAGFTYSEGALYYLIAKDGVRTLPPTTPVAHRSGE